MTTLLRQYPRPEIEVDRTGYGLRIRAIRKLADGRRHVRVTNQLFPQAICIPMSSEMTITQWHVPVDDTNCYWYALFTSFSAPTDKNRMRSQRLELYELPHYVSRKNQRNHYGYDPAEQRTRTFTGMGDDINVHDQWAVESMGAIQDRTREHLGRTDAAIREYRRCLLESIADLEAGGLSAGAERLNGRFGPAAVDAISKGDGWREEWRDLDQERRTRCPWNADLASADTIGKTGTDHGRD